VRIAIAVTVVALQAIAPAAPAPVAAAGRAWTPGAKRGGPAADSAAVMALLDGVTNRACPAPGVATGGQPTAAHLRALARAGYRTVLDLRTADEPRGFDEVAAMRAAGLRYVRLPVASGELADTTLAAFRAAMREALPGKVFVHCASGNRVGAAMIPWLVLDRGWALERAVTTARAGGLRSEELERLALDYVERMRR
jgi:uncharacterized protein (TIGR01244 family)